MLFVLEVDDGTRLNENQGEAQQNIQKFSATTRSDIFGGFKISPYFLRFSVVHFFFSLSVANTLSS